MAEMQPLVGKKDKANSVEHDQCVHNLKSTHRVIHDKKMKSSSTPATTTQSSVKETLYNATAYPPSSHRHNEKTDAVSYVTAKDMCPINTVSDPGLIKMINILDMQ